MFPSEEPRSEPAAPAEDAAPVPADDTPRPGVPNLADLPRSRPARRPDRLPFAAERPEADGGGLANWQVPLDGPPQPIEDFKGKLSIPVPVAGRIVFPERLSNFVLLSGNDGKGRDVWRVWSKKTLTLLLRVQNPATLLMSSPNRWAKAS